ncbi:MAG: DUF31 family protein [Malacoplasma sp.]|nr:DUF31 family protein [Malacoplasma sp.]
MKLVKLLKKFFVGIFLTGFIFPLTSCSQVDEKELYEKNYYVETQETNLIKQRSLELIFNFSNTTISGTGWVWSQSGDYYYIATNLHVAKFITYPKNIFINDKGVVEDCTHIETFTSKINYSINSNSIANEISVANPTIVYSTLMDNQYNQIMNGDSPQYYIDNNSYYGISDICILRYYFPTNENDFSDEIKNNISTYKNFIRDWINNFDQNQIQIYDGNAINLSDYVFYSGGFPKKIKENRIEWEPLSDFTFNKKVTDYSTPLYDKLNKPNNEFSASSTLITFIDHNFKQNNQISDNNYTEHAWYTNYLNISYTGYFYAHSDEGASGSMLVTKINNQLYIVGIYWGVSKFEIGNDFRDLGSFDIFVTQKYNIVKEVNNFIAKDISLIETN